MNTSNCDFSPMKIKLKDGLLQITEELRQSIVDLENKDNCILCLLESIKDKFNQLESVAGTFYLSCYLAAYTDKFEELSECVRRLSNRRHGALIVVERQDRLDSLIQKGISIGAVLTPSLLETIFYPGNPLHDGAVLIRGNQIVSAANILPLTSAIFSEKKVGTRHRAALGLSEQSDALILVVSEETGKISFALDGVLYPINTI